MAASEARGGDGSNSKRHDVRVHCRGTLGRDSVQYGDELLRTLRALPRLGRLGRWRQRLAERSRQLRSVASVVALIRDQHARICSLFTPIGVDVELHEMRLGRLRELVDVLAAHSAAEDAGMYPWAIRNLPLVAQRMLYVRIGRWIGRS